MGFIMVEVNLKYLCHTFFFISFSESLFLLLILLSSHHWWQPFIIRCLRLFYCNIEFHIFLGLNLVWTWAWTSMAAIAEISFSTISTLLDGADFFAKAEITQCRKDARSTNDKAVESDNSYRNAYNDNDDNDEPGVPGKTHSFFGWFRFSTFSCILFVNGCTIN